MSSYGKFPKKNGREQRPNPATDFSNDPGMTVQADRDEADINKIVSRFQKSGVLPPSMRGEPFYGDVSEIGDYQESLIKVQEAQALFMQYPADLRERFNNDPAELIEFLAHDENREEAIKLGLVVKPLPAPEPAPDAAAAAAAPGK